ncbi:MAG: aldehyde dehydrogenase family protein, partial [Comamonadaceae bacterium]
MRNYHTIFVNGQWVPSTGDATIEIVSPHDETVIATVPNGTPDDIDAAVAAARLAFDTGPWPQMALPERLRYLTRLADLYEARLDEFAEIITAEMGAPITLSRTRQAAGGLYCLRSTIALAAEYN